MIVTRRHLFTVPGFSKRPGFCRDKSKTWFASHGLDWRAFVRDGIDEQVLLATDDAMALAVVRWAHQCEAGRG